MSDKLINNFNSEHYFKELKSSDPVQFEELYDVLTKWATSEQQTLLSYSDFAAAEEQNQGDGFKKL